MGEGVDSGRRGKANFEHLLVLRWSYPMRSDYDRRAVLSVSAAIDYGEWRMRLVRVNELRRGVWATGRAA